ncbi:MAG: hypothetical protein JRI79_01105 [Deltaproteobacteria bacterium]|nr:hypothetical protein [Deltaproteobacteria bacterium]MBW1918785.1 hypothetical protein [Deltaproteobacteria bacterium]MBW1934794.1 hypothetical protein [Deltaproteobacteria bacterium]MBW1976555.1 hypothetical protein [Deltaproteobacteria bacterium]MBW2044935.1 hypothetical protein [Deltaproteobacteria bacterium]
MDQRRPEEQIRVPMHNSNSDEINLGLADATGALLMINKKERRLLKELLSMSMKSPSARKWISKKLGPEYVRIGERLLKTMGGD